MTFSARNFSKFLLFKEKICASFVNWDVAQVWSFGDILSRFDVKSIDNASGASTRFKGGLCGSGFDDRMHRTSSGAPSGQSQASWFQRWKYSNVRQRGSHKSLYGWMIWISYIYPTECSARYMPFVNYIVNKKFHIVLNITWNSFPGILSN